MIFHYYIWLISFWFSVGRDGHIPKYCDFFRVGNCFWLVLVPVVTYLDIVMLQYLVMYVRCYSIMPVEVLFHCKGVAT